MAYKPPSGNSSRTIPYRALVNTIDPDLERAKHYAPEYRLSNGRAFYADPTKRGAANRLGNVYPVGAQQGSADPDVAAGLATTVGNEVPGLYESVDTPGWDS
jgi:hypothetical protein